MRRRRTTRPWRFAGILAVLVGGVGSWRATGPEPALAWHIDGSGRGTPATDGRTVFFLTADHAVVALDIATGARRWRSSTGGLARHSAGSRLVVAGDVVVAGDDHLVAFDRRSGRLRWTYRPADDSFPGVHLGSVSDGVVFAGSFDGILHAVDAATGVPRWTARVGDQGVVFAPRVAAGIVVASVGTSPGRVVALDASTGIERWRHTLARSPSGAAGEGAVGRPVVIDDVVVAAARDGRLVALDLRTGAHRWSLPPATRPDGRPAPPADVRPVAAVGGQLVVGSLTGLLVAYDLTTMGESWRRAPEPASVAFEIGVGDDVVYVPFLNGRLLALDPASGATLWQLGGGGRDLRWPPLTYHSRLFVTGLDAGFLAFERPSTRRLAWLPVG